MPSKKYYWLKLHRDFFKRHDVKIVEAHENGKDYIIFYLKLLTECIDHDGKLRFSDELPYDEKMLSVITGTNVDIVRSAVSAFTTMGLMERWDDGTYYMSKIDKMIGAETEWAAKKRDQRAIKDKKEDIVPALSQPCHKIVRQEIETELEIEIKKREGGRVPRFTPPTIQDVKDYGKEYTGKRFDDAERFVDFYTSKGWMVGKAKMKDWKASLRNWARKDSQPGPDVKEIEAGERRREQERKDIQAAKAGVEIPSVMKVITTKATQGFREATS